MDGMSGVLLLLLCHTCSGLVVTAPPAQVAVMYSQTVLPCSFRVDDPSINQQFLAIIWHFGNKELLRFDNKETVVTEGFSFNKLEASQGNASLTVHNVTIADQGAYRCLVIYSPNRQEKEISLNVYAPPEVRIQRKALTKADNNKIYCAISNFYPREITITWLLNDNQVLSGSETGEFKKNADGTYRVNSSIVLNPSQIQKHPSIACQVEHMSIPRPIRDAFTVLYGVSPDVRLTSSRTQDHNEHIYLCEARGFSPEALSIDWLVDGKKVDPSKGRVGSVFNREIYYQINLKEGNVPGRISCSVQHETLDSPVTETLQVPQFNDCLANCHSGLTALISMLLIASLVFIGFSSYLILKKKYLRRFQVSDILQQHTLDNGGDVVTLYCMALQCPQGAYAIWTLTIEGDKPITISDCRQYKDEETGPLLHKDYTMRTEQTERNGLHNVTTMLSFHPSASEFKNLHAKCKFICGGKHKERSLTCTFPHIKPEIQDSIKFYLNDSNTVVCSVALEKFYPRNIQIHWSYGADQYMDATTTKEEITPNTADRSYRIVSECKIPNRSLQDSSNKTRVRVTWRHPSMDQPESREVTLTEIPRQPVMETIDVPSLLHSKEARLECKIRGYRPDNLVVRWFRREGMADLYEVSSGDRYKIPVIQSAQQSDETYTGTAVLIFTPSAITDHNSAFICRVSHPSLQSYLEETTGSLNVKGVPKIEIEYQGGALRANISNFIPKDINVTWRHKSIATSKKMTDVKSSEVKTLAFSNNEDGTFTTVQEMSVKKNLHKKQYVITVEHEALKSPVTTIISRKDGKFYQNDEKVELKAKNQAVEKESSTPQQDTDKS